MGRVNILYKHAKFSSTKNVPLVLPIAMISFGVIDLARYSIGKLAQSIGTTQRNLETVFQRHENTTPGRYYLKLRLQSARKMIEESHLPLATIAQATGFSSQSHFGKCFKEAYNIQPSQLRSSDD